MENASSHVRSSHPSIIMGVHAGPRDQALAALSRVAINLIFSCLLKKPNKPKKAKDVKLQ